MDDDLEQWEYFNETYPEYYDDTDLLNKFDVDDVYFDPEEIEFLSGAFNENSYPDLRPKRNRYKETKYI